MTLPSSATLALLTLAALADDGTQGAYRRATAEYDLARAELTDALPVYERCLIEHHGA